MSLPARCTSTLSTSASCVNGTVPPPPTSQSTRPSATTTPVVRSSCGSAKRPVSSSGTPPSSSSASLPVTNPAAPLTNNTWMTARPTSPTTTFTSHPPSGSVSLTTSLCCLHGQQALTPAHGLMTARVLHPLTTPHLRPVRSQLTRLPQSVLTTSPRIILMVT